MLGRVMAADFALALLAESISAFVCGILMDHYPKFWTANTMSIFMGCVCTVCMILWWIYHYSGGGAASSEAKLMAANASAAAEAMTITKTKFKNPIKRGTS